MDERTEIMKGLGQRARAAGRTLARATAEARTAALYRMADALEAAQGPILTANALDLAHADARGITGALRDRLALNPDRLASMARGVREVAAWPDPVGAVAERWTRPNGLVVSRVRIALGVIGIVYEARPNVTADAAALCVRSGNAVFLRGGSEAEHANAAILAVLRDALTASGLPADALMALPSTDRAWLLPMLQADEYIDVIIPRGGEGLIRYVAEHSRIPVIKHYKGVCHVFVDAAADPAKALDIVLNAKVQRPGVCNALETLLIHEAIAPTFLPEVAQRLRAAGVELRGCAASRQLVAMTAATEDDWHAEYLDLILAVRIVPDLDAAIAHIERYGSDHTEAIVSEDAETTRRFLHDVQSAVVVANASTRFADGGQLGLGAEIGISTTRLHAYGPMGANDLTTLKYVVEGSGQTRT